MSTPRRAAVIGGGGHIGSAICRALLDHGWRVTAIGRRARTPANLQGLPLDYRSCSDEEALNRTVAASGCHWLFDAAAAYPLHRHQPTPPAAQRARQLIALARAQGAGLCAIGSFVTDEPANESHPYFLAKQAAERTLLSADIPLTLINPTLCLGPWDGKAEQLALVPMLLRGALPAVVDHVVNIVDVRDVARAAVLSTDRTEVHGQPMVISGHNRTLPELVRSICRMSKAQPPLLTVPTGPSLALANMAEAGYAAIGQRSPAPALAIELVTRHRRRAPGVLQRQLLSELTPLETTLIDSIRWHGGQISQAADAPTPYRAAR